jgi:hypothetical protein
MKNIKSENSTTSANDVEKSRSEFSWFNTSLKISAALVTIAGLSLHLMGELAHRNYLNNLGVDPGLFPKATDWIIINGYYAYIDRATVFLRLLGDNTLIWAIGSIILVFYIFLIFLLNRKSSWPWLDNKLGHAGPLTRDFAKSVVLSVGIVTSVPAILIGTALVLAFPAILGEGYGIAAAKNDTVAFAMQCSDTSGRQRCSEIYKDGELLAQGYVFESSESHIAIFDVSMKRTRIIERGGTELRGPLEPLSKVDHKNIKSPKK